eukprot:gene17693-biopygen13697
MLCRAGGRGRAGAVRPPCSHRVATGAAGAQRRCVPVVSVPGTFAGIVADSNGRRRQHSSWGAVRVDNPTAGKMQCGGAAPAGAPERVQRSDQELSDLPAVQGVRK